MKPYDATQIRSFALAGHGGAGKTSVAEGIARLGGVTNRLGSVLEGSTVTDYEDEEKERGGSIQTSFLTAEYEGFKFHVADTPGDGDFIHDAHLALQGVDAVVLVVSAVDGVETSTERMSALADELGIPKAVFINKLDRDNTDHEATLSEIKETLGMPVALLHLPIGRGESFRGLVDLVNKKAWMYSGDGGVPTEAPIPPEMAADVERAIEKMTDSVAMTDDELVEVYLETGSLTEEQLRAGLMKGISGGTVVPVCLGAATKNIGMDRLLRLARAAFPTPLSRSLPAFRGEEATSVKGDPDGPFAALCFKDIIDPFIGHLSVFRCFRGHAGADYSPVNVRTGEKERFGTYFHFAGKKTVPVEKVVAGDVFAVAKLKGTHTSDTVADPKDPVRIRWVDPPAPMISYVIKPLTRADEDKVRGALDKILAEDRGLVQSFDPVTKEIVLAGRGANHVNVSVHKMKRKYGVNVELGTPTIPYRETISAAADVRYRHKKQTGGAGQFGEVAIRVMPNERGGGFVFEDETVGGVIPHSLIPSVEKGVRHTLDQGVLAGFPVVDVRVELYDGKHHPVDSKDIAFQMAGRQAMKQAVAQARPVLLEPVYDVEVVVPEQNVGDIMGDMNQRRARVQGMDTRGRNSVIKATVPLAEMLTYAPALKSMTGGKGAYTMHFHSYEPVPYSSQEKLVHEVSRLKHHAEEE